MSFEKRKLNFNGGFLFPNTALGNSNLICLKFIIIMIIIIMIIIIIIIIIIMSQCETLESCPHYE